VTDEQIAFTFLVGPMLSIDELIAQREAEEDEPEFVSPNVPGRNCWELSRRDSRTTPEESG
jgi:hypothetical protein